MAYINQEATIKEIEKMPAYFESGDIRYGIIVAIDIVKKQSPADVVEVVRCKDCRHLIPDKMLCTHIRNRTFNTGFTTFSENFCSYGERKD